MGFDKTMAIKMAGYAGKSYVQLTFSKDNDGFLLENDSYGNQILSFPGSEQIKDWIEDGEFVKVKREGLGWIHNGFADTWDGLKNELIPKLDRTKPLYITGHSLGGAVATVASLALYNRGFKIDGLFTFGSPRVGNSEWKSNFEKSGIIYNRVMNGDDIVTTIPKLFYYHVGEEVRINKRGFFSWFHDKFTDHKMENYLESLDKVVKSFVAR